MRLVSAGMLVASVSAAARYQTIVLTVKPGSSEPCARAAWPAHALAEECSCNILPFARVIHTFHLRMRGIMEMFTLQRRLYLLLYHGFGHLLLLPGLTVHQGNDLLHRRIGDGHVYDVAILHDCRDDWLQWTERR